MKALLFSLYKKLVEPLISDSQSEAVKEEGIVNTTNSPIKNTVSDKLNTTQVVSDSYLQEANSMELAERKRLEEFEAARKIEEANEKHTEKIDIYARTKFEYVDNQEDNEYFGGKNIDLTNRDNLFDDCARLVVQMQSGSTSNLQRRLNLGYNRAGRIMDQLEAAGIVGPANGAAARSVYFRSEEELLSHLLELPIFPSDFYEKNKERIEERRDYYTQYYRALKKNKEQREKDAEKEKIRKELLAKEKKKQLYNDVYNELKKEGKISGTTIDDERRESIPQDIMDKVWNRDGGKCVQCGSQKSLEFDHIIPFSKGGANTYRNLQILCKQCNIQKSDKIG